MGITPTQEYYTPERIQGMLDWRPPGKVRKRSLCEGFCALFGTAKCPHSDKTLPKHGHCDQFVLNAKDASDFSKLVVNDRARYTNVLARRSLTIAVPLRPADEHID